MVQKTAKKKVKTKVFQIQSILRAYIYAVEVTADTGRVLNITAGCRFWKSFEEAQQHYDGVHRPENASTWRDDDRANLAGPAADTTTINWYNRQEARIILTRLAMEVELYKGKIRREKAAAKKKAAKKTR